MNNTERMRLYRAAHPEYRIKERKAARKRRQENPTAGRDYMRHRRKNLEIRVADREYAKKRRAGNPEKARRESRAFQQTHPDYFAAASALRRARVLKRTPTWADLKKIRTIYEQAKLLTEKTGLVYSVDHELPLCGKKVSGLHVAENLRVLPLHLNQRKSATWEPG